MHTICPCIKFSFLHGINSRRNSVWTLQQSLFFFRQQMNACCYSSSWNQSEAAYFYRRHRRRIQSLIPPKRSSIKNVLFQEDSSTNNWFHRLDVLCEIRVKHQRGGWGRASLSSSLFLGVKSHLQICPYVIVNCLPKNQISLSNWQTNSTEPSQCHMPQLQTIWAFQDRGLQLFPSTLMIIKLVWEKYFPNTLV